MNRVEQYLLNSGNQPVRYNGVASVTPYIQDSTFVADQYEGSINEEYEKTANILEDKYYKAEETKNAIELGLANVADKMHESERSYINGLVTEVENQIKPFIEKGEISYANPILKKLATKIESDRGLRSRVKKHEEYLAFKEHLKALYDKGADNGGISKEQYDHYIKENPYTQVGQVNPETGFPENDKFEPKGEPVRGIDFNKLMDTFISNYNVDGRFNGLTPFYDSNGLITHYENSNSEYISLNEVTKGLENVISNDIQASEYIDEIAKIRNLDENGKLGIIRSMISSYANKAAFNMTKGTAGLGSSDAARASGYANQKPENPLIPFTTEELNNPNGLTDLDFNDISGDVENLLPKPDVEFIYTKGNSDGTNTLAPYSKLTRTMYESWKKDPESIEVNNKVLYKMLDSWFNSKQYKDGLAILTLSDAIKDKSKDIYTAAKELPGESNLKSQILAIGESIAGKDLILQKEDNVWSNEEFNFKFNQLYQAKKNEFNKLKVGVTIEDDSEIVEEQTKKLVGTAGDSSDNGKVGLISQRGLIVLDAHKLGDELVGESQGFEALLKTMDMSSNDFIKNATYAGEISSDNPYYPAGKIVTLRSLDGENAYSILVTNDNLEHTNKNQGAWTLSQGKYNSNNSKNTVKTPDGNIEVEWKDVFTDVNGNINYFRKPSIVLKKKENGKVVTLGIKEILAKINEAGFSYTLEDFGYDEYTKTIDEDKFKFIQTILLQ